MPLFINSVQEFLMINTEFNRKLLKQEARTRIREIRRKQRVHAPKFPPDFQWLNAAAISVEGLRGKVVLLDFWTYCCINCLHVIPDLKYLEMKYADAPFAVIGVHSAKFDNEQNQDNIKEAILRYEIEHPVIVDEALVLWDAYAVRGWPTFVLIDPEGYVIARFSGEENREILDVYIEAMLEIYEKRHLLNYQPLLLDPEKHYQFSQLLRYPGKILADGQGQRLFIADSNHNRILVTTFAGNVLEVIGGGKPGFTDGNFSKAAFRQPQGMAIAGEMLYVADTGNHAIRRVNLTKKIVETIAGTGEQARLTGVGSAEKQTALNAPWDLFVQNDALFIAMAGLHQIWRMDLKTQVIAPFAGSGREARRDGALNEAMFAQPSGISGDGHRFLFIADSESSCIRQIDLQNDAVETLAGPKAPGSGRGDLFVFGDRDGSGDAVRLQHPLGIHFHDGKIYIADTYNHKIKRLDPQTRVCETILGSDEKGMSGGADATFYEPSGLAIAGQKTFIADTNNHQIRVFDMAATTGVLNIRGLGKTLNRHNAAMLCTSIATQEITLPRQKIDANADGVLCVRIHLPDGHQFNSASPFEYVLRTQGTVLNSEIANQIQSPEQSLDMLEIAWQSGEAAQKANIALELQFYFCSHGEGGQCRLRSVIYKIPLLTVVNGQREILIDDVVSKS